MLQHLLSEQDTWRDRAACLEYPAVLFFGLDDIENSAEKRAREDRAKSVCYACPVRQECLEYAISSREQYGIWGGLTELERRSRWRRRIS